MVFFSVVTPPPLLELSMLPPYSLVLPEKVLLLTFAVPLLLMPPPLPALLPEKVLLLTVSAPSL